MGAGGTFPLFPRWGGERSLPHRTRGGDSPALAGSREVDPRLQPILGRSWCVPPEGCPLLPAQHLLQPGDTRRGEPCPSARPFSRLPLTSSSSSSSSPGLWKWSRTTR